MVENIIHVLHWSSRLGTEKSGQQLVLRVVAPESVLWTYLEQFHSVPRLILVALVASARRLLREWTILELYMDREQCG